MWHLSNFWQLLCAKTFTRLAATLWWFTAAPKPLKYKFWGSSSPQGSHSPYILGDITRPGHVTCVLVWSKSDRRRLRKTLHKQTDKQTDTTKIMVTWPWTNNTRRRAVSLRETSVRSSVSSACVVIITWFGAASATARRHGPPCSSSGPSDATSPRSSRRRRSSPLPDTGRRPPRPPPTAPGTLTSWGHVTAGDVAHDVTTGCDDVTRNLNG